MTPLEDLITIEFFFQKTELIVTFLIVLLGITFGNIRMTTEFKAFFFSFKIGQAACLATLPMSNWFFLAFRADRS